MKYWFYHIVKFILEIFFRLGFGLKVHGIEHIPKTGGVLLASNHLSYLDPPLLGAACPRRIVFMAAADLFSDRYLGAFMRAVHVIPLEREGGDFAAIREAVRRLRKGDVVTIFPEGGRQFSGKLGQARRGVGLVASAARVPVVPVLVSGTFKALPPGSRWFRRAKIQVAFGPQISYTIGHSVSAQFQHTEAGMSWRHEALAEAVTQSWRHLHNELTKK